MHAWREQSLYTQRCGEGSMPSSLCQCESWRCFVARSTASEHVTCHFQSHFSIFSTFFGCFVRSLDLTDFERIIIVYIPTIAQLCTIWDLFSEANSKREVEEEHR